LGFRQLPKVLILPSIPHVQEALMHRFPCNPKTLAAAFALLISFAALPVQAQTLVSNKNFSLTFPAGWTASTIGSGDSGFTFVMQPLAGTVSYLYGIPHTGMLTAQEMADLMSTYGTADSLSITASGTKALGGKEFTFTEIVSSANDSDRVRVYFLSQGNFLFEGVLNYDPLKAGSLAEFEGALGTLVLSPSAGLRPAVVSLRPANGGTGHDALGRMHLQGTEKGRQPVLPLFLRR
jgi:hypothetical protein